MTDSSTIPVTIRPEAAARVDELGLQQEFEQILGFVCRNFSGLSRLDVILSEPYDHVDDPIVYFEPHVLHPPPGEEPDREPWQSWCHWMTSAFSPDVLRHFNLSEVYESPNGR
jgi:hypothetical protein